MNTRHAQQPRRQQPLQAWLLAALLLAAQALGLAHRVAHAPGLPAAALGQATLALVAGAHADGHTDGHTDGHAHSHAHSGAEAQDHTHHEAGSADCRLIDQLAHADALCGNASLPPALPRAAATGPAASLPALPAGSAAGYLARGPPGLAFSGVLIAG